MRPKPHRLSICSGVMPMTVIIEIINGHWDNWFVSGSSMFLSAPQHLTVSLINAHSIGSKSPPWWESHSLKAGRCRHYRVRAWVRRCCPVLFFPRSCSVLPQNKKKKIKRQIDGRMEEPGLRKNVFLRELDIFKKSSRLSRWRGKELG